MKQFKRTRVAMLVTLMFLVTSISLTEFKAYDDVQLERTKIILTEGFNKLDCPYVWGANSTKEFDCSSLVQYVFKQANISLPRTSAIQATCGEEVPPNEIRAGDLLFFDTRPGISVPVKTTHVGIYMGKDYVLHASSVEGKVVIQQLSTSGMVPLITHIRRMY